MNLKKKRGERSASGSCRDVVDDSLDDHVPVPKVRTLAPASLFMQIRFLGDYFQSFQTTRLHFEYSPLSVFFKNNVPCNLFRKFF